MKIRLFHAFALPLFTTALCTGAASAEIVFDNFNVNEGHFGFSPTFSTTSIGEDPGSSADRATFPDAVEGPGHQAITLVHDATATALRIRHLSGGPPYTS